MTAARIARPNALNKLSTLWWVLRPYRMRACKFISAAKATAWKKSSTVSVSKPPSRGFVSSASKTKYDRPLRSTLTWPKVSSIGTNSVPYRSIPCLSPNACLKHSPSTIPVSSVVWCGSTSRSPWHFTTNPKRPCFANKFNMWFKKPIPVSISIPLCSSKFKLISIWVSFVSRLIVACRMFISSSSAKTTTGCNHNQYQLLITP